jgi:FMN phosphatase YigB (HAD superfamily)
MFDFDGTLTATPGDRAARSQKRIELRQRASMLEPCLKAMQESGATLGIISKSTEGTIRDALQAAGLSAYFQGPVVGKAVSFEGKAGIIDDLARKGAFAGFESAGLVEQAASQRVLLVDDDVMELERARCAGLQTYAAPSKGGLRHEDFETILAAMHGSTPFLQQQWQQQQQQQQALRSAVGSAPSPGRFGAHRGSPSWPAAGSPSLSATRRGYSVSDLSCGRASGKWRNLILFSGECFEG